MVPEAMLGTKVRIGWGLRETSLKYLLPHYFLRNSQGQGVRRRGRGGRGRGRHTELGSTKCEKMGTLLAMLLGSWE